MSALERSTAEERRHRQNKIFLMLIAVVLVVGFIALANWFQWWAVGGRRADAATVPCPAQKVSDPELTRVNVFNGTDRHGLAAAVSKELQRRNFHVISVANKQQAKPLELVAAIRFGPSGAVAARTVSLQFPAKVELTKDDRHDGTVDVILGQKYKGMIGRMEGARAIIPAPTREGCTPVSS